MKVLLLSSLVLLTAARPRDPDHYLVPWERLVRSSAGKDLDTPDNIPTALRLEADEELVELRDNLNNLGFELFEVNNGRNEDFNSLDTGSEEVKKEDMEEIQAVEIMEEMEKVEGMEEIVDMAEKEVMEEKEKMEDSEQEQKKELHLKDMVDFRVPDGITADEVAEATEDRENNPELSEVGDMEAVEDSSVDSLEEPLIDIAGNELETSESSEEDRDTRARPRSLDYYFKFIDTWEVDGGSRGGDTYVVSQCCHEVKIQGGQ